MASENSVALIVGVTGIVGLSLAEAMRKPTAPGGPWTVYGAARRAGGPDEHWFPSSQLLHGFIQLDALDRDDTVAKLSPIAHRVTHLFWVAVKLCPDEELRIKTNSTMFLNVLEALTSGAASSLRHVSIATGTRHYMGPISDPKYAGELGCVDDSAVIPWREDTPRRPFPNFYYALEDVAASYESLTSWSVHRASIILGASARSLHNWLLTFSVYAEICRHEGAPFRFPGSRYAWEHFCDASDSGLIADQQLWAATTEAAKNQAFNCTNGDVFTWKSFWRVLGEALKVDSVPCCDLEKEGDQQGFDLVEAMRGKGPIWDAIVKDHGLCATKMEEITCFKAVNVVLNFEFQHVCSMNKSRKFGFLASVDTVKSIPVWIERMREMNLIPRR